MTVRRAARHLPALACVLLAHVLVIFALFTLTYRHEPPRTGEAESLTWLLLPGAVTSPSVPRAPPGSNRVPSLRHTPPGAKSQPAQGSPVPAPDWSADAAFAAEQEAGAIELGRGQSRALMPRASALMRPPAPHAPPFHWDRAHTQRVEPLATGGTLVHLSERCALVLYFVIPMAGCALGEIPARGHLFDHMHDPPVLGAWKDK
jgi:hypothetical protein